MSVYRIVQAPDLVAIQMEKIHDTRIIPLDSRAHAVVVPFASISAIREAAGKATRSWSRPRTFIPTEIPMGGYSVALG